MVLAAGILAGCAAAPPPSAAEQAELAACTQQADAVYAQSNLNALGRTSQNGLYMAPMPNHVFDGQRMGTLNARNNQIRACMENGNPGAGAPAAASLPAPRIIDNP